MMNTMSCPICYEEIYSDVGKGCKMCGMPIDKDGEFCSEECEIKYNKINNLNNTGGKKWYMKIARWGEA